MSFFGEKFLDPSVDVPHSPPGTYPMAPFDNGKNLTDSEKRFFLKNTEKNLRKTALYTRSLLELAKEEFLSGTKLAE